VPGLSALLSWRQRSRLRRRQGKKKQVTRIATLVPPGLTGPELATIAGSVLFHYQRVDFEGLPLQCRPMAASLLVRAARLVVMGERGSGRAVQKDLDRCAAAVYSHLGLRPVSHASAAEGALGALESETDRQLQSFFSGPHLPFAVLVERLAPELGPRPRAQVATAVEELIRDLAEQFGTAGPLRMVE
jgi:hypothetical protein